MYVVSFTGDNPPDVTANDVLIDLLKRGLFDHENFDGVYDKMGVGCACNSEYGMECALIFGNRALIKPSSIF